MTLIPTRLYTPWRLALLAMAAAALLAVGAAPANAAYTSPPQSVAVLGDSISQAYNSACFGDCPAYSWATGTALPNSLANQIAADNGSSVTRYNDSVSGSRVEHINAQAQAAVAQGADLVAIEIGGNDACRPTLAQMTETGVYQKRFHAAMDTITAGLPNARVLVMSVPDVYQLWQIFHTSPTAQFVWSTFNICQSLLANPTSTDQADVDRRAAVRTQVQEYNKRLQQSCAKYTNCTSDNNAVFNTAFVASDITFDFFHPTVQGQGKLAAAAYAAGAPF